MLLHTTLVAVLSLSSFFIRCLYYIFYNNMLGVLSDNCSTIYLVYQDITTCSTKLVPHRALWKALVSLSFLFTCCLYYLFYNNTAGSSQKLNSYLSGI